MGAALLFPALSAQAGHYSVAYAGGQMSATHNGVSSAPINYILQSDNTWGGRIVAAFMGGYGSPRPQSGGAQCFGPITVTGTWHPDYTGEPPPTSVIVTQTCTAGWTGSLIGCTPTVAAANGLGSPLVVNADKSIGSSSGSSYQVVAGAQTISFPCSPSASVFGTGTATPPTGGTETVYVSYKAVMVPVAINVTGLSGTSVLIGQGVTAGLDTGGFPQSNWQWNATGDPFAGFVWTSDPNNPAVGTGQAVELTAIVKQQAVFYYFYRSVGNSGDTSTISCTATVTLPDGTTPQVTASQTVKVYKPDSSLAPISGPVGLWNLNGVAYLAPFNQNTQRGMQWTGIATTPPQFIGEEGAGVWGIAQLANIVVYTIDLNGNKTTFPYNGLLGLDTHFLYGSDSYPADGTKGISGDTPKVGLAGNKEAYYDGSFNTYMLYNPPDANGNSGTTWVPLRKFDWSFVGDAVLDPVKGWGLALSNGATATAVSETTTLPTWTRIIFAMQ